MVILCCEGGDAAIPKLLRNVLFLGISQCYARVASCYTANAYILVLFALFAVALFCPTFLQNVAPGRRGASLLSTQQSDLPDVIALPAIVAVFSSSCNKVDQILVTIWAIIPQQWRVSRLLTLMTCFLSAVRDPGA